MTKPRSKEWSQAMHTKRQLKQRYGVYCNRFLYPQIEEIARNSFVFLDRQTNTKELRRFNLPVDICVDNRTNIKVPVESDGTIRVYCAWDTRRNTFYTVLPWFEDDGDFMNDYNTNHKNNFVNR